MKRLGRRLLLLRLDTDHQVFVKAMVDVARGLGKSVVAEYVESEKTFNMLREFGVDLVRATCSTCRFHLPGHNHGLR